MMSFGFGTAGGRDDGPGTLPSPIEGTDEEVRDELPPVPPCFVFVG